MMNLQIRMDEINDEKRRLPAGSTFIWVDPEEFMDW